VFRVVSYRSLWWERTLHRANSAVTWSREKRTGPQQQDQMLSGPGRSGDVWQDFPTINNLILVYLVAIMKWHTLVVINIRNWFLVGGWKTKIKCQLVLVKAAFWLRGGTFLLCLHMEKGTQTPSGLFYEGTNPIHETPLSWPSHPQKPQLLIPPYGGWSFHMWICRGT
jgi:hypothetical protein